jgi:MoaA/NifB/PqqE/SkfB family radical SAM enzyme
MGRVLVLHPPTSLSSDFIDYPYFADLGAVQLAAVLRERGHEVALVDAHALEGSSLTRRADGRVHLGASVAEVLGAAKAEAAELGEGFEAAVVAFTPFHRPPARDDVLGDVLRRLTQLLGDAPLLLADCYQSGQHYVEAGDELLRSYPEACAWVKYEAEQTVPALLQRFFVEGVRPSGMHRGSSPPLDSLPVPAWDLVDLAANDRFRARVVRNLGRGAWAFPIDGRTLPLVTSRGCPYNCVHCSSNPGRQKGEPKVQRRYSARRLRAYVQTMKERFGATRLEALDELLNLDEDHFAAFVSEVAAQGLRFDAPNGLRADHLDRAQLERMKGLVTTVSVSAESGVQRVVDEVVRKKLDLRRILEISRDAHEIGVPLMVHFIIGLPGESAEEINGTLAFAMELFDRYRAWPAVQFATPLPGTQLARGRELPAVSDWGPRFQKAPSQPDALVAPEVLQQFMWTFQQRLAASHGPQKLILNVTYVCNNRCTFCAVGTRTQIHGHRDRQREHLDRYRAQGVRMVDFDGGEPTLHPELVQLIRYARHIGYERVNVTTNGRLCAYEEYARRLVRSGLTTLLFSVHGPTAQLHAQQVGVPEAFEQTTLGIQHCLRHAPRGVELGMNITLTRGNHDKLEQVTQLAWDLGLRWLNIQFLTPFGRATRGVMPDTEKAAAIAMDVIARWSDRMKLQVINLPFCFMPGFERYMMGDLLKLERHMVFVNNEDVNLAQYLAARRTRKPQCATCPHAVFCGGFYELENAPEPPWVFTAEDAARPHSSSLQLPVI